MAIIHVLQKMCPKKLRSIISSLFAGLAILCNFLLMVSWTPACLVIHHQYCKRFSLMQLSSYSCIQALPNVLHPVQKVENVFKTITSWRNQFLNFILPTIVIRGRYLFIMGFTLLAISAGLVVFKYPGLRLPDKDQFQLFKRNHVFER